MSISYVRWTVFVLLTFLLTTIPFPVGYENLRPFWGLFIMLYSLFNGRFNYLLVVFLGLSLDVLNMRPLGEHVFALAFVAGLSLSRARRFKFFTSLQQMIWILLLSFVYQSILLLIDYFEGHSLNYTHLFLPVATSTLAWPAFVMFVDHYLFSEKTRSI